MSSSVLRLPPGPDQVMDDLIAAYATSTATARTQAAAKSTTVPAELRLDPWAPTAATRVLPPVPTPLRSRQAALAERHDVHAFTQDELPAHVLTAVLSRITAQDTRLAAGEAEAGNALLPCVAARRVSEIDSGVYVSAASGDRLDWQMPLEAAPWQTLDQDARLPGAAVLVLLMGSPAAAWHRGGARGHLQLMRRAGSAAYAGWLAALEQGYDGCIVQAPTPSGHPTQPPDHPALNLDPVSLRPLVALAVGLREPSSG